MSGTHGAELPGIGAVCWVLVLEVAVLPTVLPISSSLQLLAAPSPC